MVLKKKKKWQICSLLQIWGQSINFSSLFISKLSAVIKPKLPFRKATFLRNIDSWTLTSGQNVKTSTVIRGHSRFGDGMTIYMVIQAKRRPSRLQCYGYTFSFRYFKTLSIDPALGKASATSRSAVKRSTDWASPDAVKTAFLRQYSLSLLSYFFFFQWEVIFKLLFWPRNQNWPNLEDISFFY